jgi:hypothetical protein
LHQTLLPIAHCCAYRWDAQQIHTFLNDGTGGGYCATHMPQDLKESNDEKVSNIKK